MKVVVLLIFFSLGGSFFVVCGPPVENYWIRGWFKFYYKLQKVGVEYENSLVMYVKLKSIIYL